jgi:hypothetical protein
MRQVLWLLVVAGIVWIRPADDALAQTRPNFSGRWVQVAGPPVPGAPRDPTLTTETIIKQVGDVVTSTVIVKRNGQIVREGQATSFRIDGREQRKIDRMFRDRVSHEAVLGSRNARHRID